MLALQFDRSETATRMSEQQAPNLLSRRLSATNACAEGSLDFMKSGILACQAGAFLPFFLIHANQEEPKHQ